VGSSWYSTLELTVQLRRVDTTVPQTAQLQVGAELAVYNAIRRQIPDWDCEMRFLRAFGAIYFNIEKTQVHIR